LCEERKKVISGFEDDRGKFIGNYWNLVGENIAVKDREVDNREQIILEGASG